MLRLLSLERTVACQIYSHFPGKVHVRKYSFFECLEASIQNNPVNLLSFVLGAEWQEATELMKILGILLQKIQYQKIATKQQKAYKHDGAKDLSLEKRQQAASEKQCMVRMKAFLQDPPLSFPLRDSDFLKLFILSRTPTFCNSSC